MSSMETNPPCGSRALEVLPTLYRVQQSARSTLSTLRTGAVTAPSVRGAPRRNIRGISERGCVVVPQAFGSAPSANTHKRPGPAAVGCRKSPGPETPLLPPSSSTGSFLGPTPPPPPRASSPPFIL
ncbi:unnamed protein product [Arctogadus glacialis]